jgi:hypothetical protein
MGTDTTCENAASAEINSGTPYQTASVDLQRCHQLCEEDATCQMF